jgi:hypothetical protein
VGNYGGVMPSVETFADVMLSVPSHFFTMDVAEQRDVGWLIVELGDDQVARPPDHADVRNLFRALQTRWPARNPG